MIRLLLIYLLVITIAILDFSSAAAISTTKQKIDNVVSEKIPVKIFKSKCSINFKKPYNDDEKGISYSEAINFCKEHVMQEHYPNIKEQVHQGQSECATAKWIYIEKLKNDGAVFEWSVWNCQALEENSENFETLELICTTMKKEPLQPR